MPARPARPPRRPPRRRPPGTAPARRRPAAPPARPRAASPAAALPSRRARPARSSAVEVLGPLRITAARAGDHRRAAQGPRAARLPRRPPRTAPPARRSPRPCGPDRPGRRRRPAAPGAAQGCADLLRHAAGRDRAEDDPAWPPAATASTPPCIATDSADFQRRPRRRPRRRRRRPRSWPPAAAPPPCTGAPLADGAGYDWAEPSAETARRRALDAWTAIADILAPREPGQALAALESALGHDPYNEYLYQKIMRLQAAAGHPEAVRRTLGLLETRLAGLGLTPGAATRQAAAALLARPGRPGQAVGSADP